jgi:transposase
LISLLYPPQKSKKSLPEPDMEYVFYEMKKKHVTLMLLWEEYKEKHPDGIMYTQFCERYRNLKKTIKSHCVRSIKLAKKWRLIGLVVL